MEAGYHIGRFLCWGTALGGLLLLLAAGPGLWRFSAAASLEPHEFNLVQWEFRHVGNKWLYLFGRRIKQDALTQAEGDVRLRHYFMLNAEIRRLEWQAGQQERERGSLSAIDLALRNHLRALTQERRRLQNDVEAVLEERLSEVLKAEGLTTAVPLTGGRLRAVWPPVDITFAQPARLLVTSPRDRIQLLDTRLLRTDLSLEEVIVLEEQTEAAAPYLSALVVSVGGYASYPATIIEGAGYRTTLETIAHEWIHHYLSFRPLGRRYTANRDMTAINETVAEIGGRELADLLQRQFPVEIDLAVVGPPRARVEADRPILDVGQTLRDLRHEVEGLLREGKVAEAEALMEERRRYLAEHGVYIRKLNQAYFAFHGLYGGSPVSINPVVPKLQALRACSPSLGDFLRRVAGVTAAADLDRLLADFSAGSSRCDEAGTPRAGRDGTVPVLPATRP